ncbi:MAG: threonine synthase [Gemmatimonadetes bacterium]|nr:threonine synthase [Gemmatimonadota bacterium]MYK66292.1 threonine synthase [Gemmatimonadota bacterium]
MQLISTRGGPDANTWTFRQALFLGQAPDGGLFVPASLQPLPTSDHATLHNLTLPERSFIAARHLLGDEIPPDTLRTATHDALDFPIPLREIEPNIHLLELFHGPTHAFKDVGARFMARMMAALRDLDDPPLTILTATSGDTGGAVAHAFHNLPGIRVAVLYPLGKVSRRQEAQFTTQGGNVTAVAVRGTFDDCQRLVRQAFADPDLNARLPLTSANSINIGRLLPQTFHYLHAWTELAPTAPGSELVFSVPSGNFGNLTAGLIARRSLGMSLAHFVAATNENDVVPAYLAGRGFHPRASVETISSAMDVGDPSNFRRIVQMFGGMGGGGTGDGPGSHESAKRPGRDEGPGRTGSQSPSTPAKPTESLTSVLTGSSWSDRETRGCIRDLWHRRGVAIDPHTAVGLLGLRRELRRRPGAHGVVLATAHPAKFAETVEPLIGQSLPVPPGIARVMDRPRRSVVIEPELEGLRRVLEPIPPARRCPKPVRGE